MNGSMCLALGLGFAAMSLSSARSEAGETQNKEKGTLVSIDGLQSKTPEDWIEEQPTNRMRFKQFRLPAAKDDKEPAELIIFFFGTGAGGSVQDNLKRWKDMFKPPEGKKIDDVAKVETLKVSDVDVTYLDVHGTYLFKSPPFDPNAETVPRPNYRLLGVVFESKKGPYFIRLVGPSATVEQHKKGFDAWLKAFK